MGASFVPKGRFLAHVVGRAVFNAWLADQRQRRAGILSIENSCYLIIFFFFFLFFSFLSFVFSFLFFWLFFGQNRGSVGSKILNFESDFKKTQK